MMSSTTRTHSVLVGYILSIFGFMGAHRFYFGKPITGTIWFFTVGLLLIGWIIDLFLIPGMARRADLRYQAGPVDYTLAWILLTFLGSSASTASTWGSGSPASFTCSQVGCWASGCSTICGRSNGQVSEINRRELFAGG